MTLLEKLAKLEHEIATLRYSIETAERHATAAIVSRPWSAVMSVIRVGVVPAIRAVRTAAKAKETAEARAVCEHLDIRWSEGSIHGKCKRCRKPMERPWAAPKGGIGA